MTAPNTGPSTSAMSAGGLRTAGMPNRPMRGLGLSGSRRSCSVGVAGCFVDAAAGQPPGHLAGPVLGELPAGCLLRAMMSPAGRREIAFAGPAPDVGSLHHRAGQPGWLARSLSWGATGHVGPCGKVTSSGYRVAMLGPANAL